MNSFSHLLQAFARPLLCLRPPRISGRIAFAVTLHVLIGLLPTVTIAQTSVIKSDVAASEDRVKAAYIYKFLNYAEWPPASFAKLETPYVIGVVGADAIVDELAKISAGRSVNNRPVIIKNFQPGDALQGIQVLFIGKAERAKQPQLLRQVHQQPILAITETEGALAQGSMINFLLIDDRVRFEVALEPVGKSGIRLSSRMLTVAISVDKGAQQ